MCYFLIFFFFFRTVYGPNRTPVLAGHSPRPAGLCKALLNLRPMDSSLARRLGFSACSLFCCSPSLPPVFQETGGKCPPCRLFLWGALQNKSPS